MEYRQSTFTAQPQRVEFHDIRDMTQVIITTGIQHSTKVYDEDDVVTDEWVGNRYIFWDKTAALDKEAIIADPDKYIGYVPTAYRQQLKDKAQKHLDEKRNNTHRVDVPSYKEGYAVMHREKDDINLLAGLVMGGLPYFEFADGQVAAPLSVDDIKLIYQDIAAHEISIQQAKQACWAAIDAATTREAADAALAAYIQGE